MTKLLEQSKYAVLSFARPFSLSLLSRPLFCNQHAQLDWILAQHGALCEAKGMQEFHLHNLSLFGKKA